MQEAFKYCIIKDRTNPSNGPILASIKCLTFLKYIYVLLLDFVLKRGTVVVHSALTAVQSYRSLYSLQIKKTKNKIKPFQCTEEHFIDYFIPSGQLPDSYLPIISKNLILALASKVLVL